ncbi:Protein kinase-like domain [Pseudocohnilembus persalinus]|uniref:non-specific serine/threonine protein kinase n=1 Tax=Pseudocohnilembus persalinus TaxID=266149 RepID=A0A0V0QPI0_PSEPJ|nr:Protein kinase-like domain [Pseudocohnilembus persalinus]|eukprot:KRX04077.1 Protein kinase-like domain [Pseudocohnilembus persalinus]
MGNCVGNSQIHCYFLERPEKNMKKISEQPITEGFVEVLEGQKNKLANKKMEKQNLELESINLINENWSFFIKEVSEEKMKKIKMGSCQSFGKTAKQRQVDNIYNQEIENNDQKNTEDSNQGSPSSKFSLLNQQNCEQKQSSSEEVIQNIRKFFGKKLVQFGFWDKYKVLDKLGEGSFACVYLIQNKENQEKMAVKVFNKGELKKQEFGIEGLELEIQILKSFDHDNLIRIYEIYESQNSIYLVMDVNNGGTLEEKMEQATQIPKSEVILIMKQLLEGLSQMHKKRIMHRDLKPENILLKNENEIQCVISDFGLATFIDLKEYLFLRCGTPGYVAPEVWEANKLTKYSEKCDIYSLGIIYHQLCFNEGPFDADTLKEITDLNQKGNIDFNDKKYRKLHPQMFDLMQKMLYKDQKKRIDCEQALQHPVFNLIEDKDQRKSAKQNSYFYQFKNQQDKNNKEDDFDKSNNQNTDKSRFITAITENGSNLNSPNLNSSSQFSPVIKSEEKNSIQQQQKLTDFDLNETSVAEKQMLKSKKVSIRANLKKKYSILCQQQQNQQQNSQNITNSNNSLQLDYIKEGNSEYSQKQIEEYKPKINMNPTVSVQLGGGTFTLADSPLMKGRDIKPNQVYKVQAENSPSLKMRYSVVNKMSNFSNYFTQINEDTEKMENQNDDEDDDNDNDNESDDESDGETDQNTEEKEENQENQLQQKEEVEEKENQLQQKKEAEEKENQQQQQNKVKEEEEKQKEEEQTQKNQCEKGQDQQNYIEVMKVDQKLDFIKQESNIQQDNNSIN